MRVPVYWLTGGNPYATHNSVVLLSFVLSAAGTYYLTRYLVGDRRAAVIAAISFAFSPYAFSRLSHIQLLMTAGIPFSLLAFHRLADRPSPRRGLVLGVTMGLQALACAYYGVFVVLLIGLAVLLIGLEGRWTDRRFWTALAVGGACALALVLPLFAQYLTLQEETGFGRALDEARAHSATPRTYLRSAAHASSWIESSVFRSAPATPQDEADVLFPGFVATLFGAAGLAVGWRTSGRFRRLALLYGTIAALALWESFGPSGGLYSLSYQLPAFTFLRAPSRFGVLVVFALSVLAAIALTRLLARSARPGLATAAFLVIACVEHVSSFRFTPVPPVQPVYRVLAMQPKGAVLEMPPLSADKAFMRTEYMLNSTTHWMPLVNAYSDHIPDDFSHNLNTLATFPSDAAFSVLPAGVRYVTFQVNEYRKNALLDELTSHLARFAPYLRRLHADDGVWLYEIIGSPRLE